MYYIVTHVQLGHMCHDYVKLKTNCILEQLLQPHMVRYHPHVNIAIRDNDRNSRPKRHQYYLIHYRISRLSRVDFQVSKYYHGVAKRPTTYIRMLLMHIILHKRNQYILKNNEMVHHRLTW